MTNGLQRAIGLFAVVALLALGMGYILEKGRLGAPASGVPEASQPASPGDATKSGPAEPTYDRSDLVLSLG